MNVTINVNGKDIADTIRPDELLIDFLRSHGCPSVKRGCETSNCGACTVHMDGKAVLSCAILAARCEGHQITTLEGLQEEAKEFGGFIADQGPRWVNIHEWIPFLSQDTPVYTGTERIARKVNATVFFASVECPRRGYYVCTLEKMTDDPASLPRFALTNDYMARLEAMIRRHPERWLWTHKRWKRRHEDEPTQFERRNEKEAVGTQSKGV